jgi:hypothetical protein
MAVYQCLECNTLHMVYKSCGNQRVCYAAMFKASSHPPYRPWRGCVRREMACFTRYFFLPVHALSKIFKAKFKHEMDKAGLLDKIPVTMVCKAVILPCMILPIGYG